MKKIFFVIIIGYFCIADSYAGVMCHKTGALGNISAATVYLNKFGFYFATGALLNQYPMVHGSLSDVTATNTKSKVLIQGICATNESSMPLEFNELGGIVTDDTDTHGWTINCWCQMIYPYVSKVVFNYSLNRARTTDADACMAQCTSKCIDNMQSSSSLRTYLLIPSEILYQ
ncbi:MAG: hypothetical protein IKB05_02795 [Alphaproteobacteria bacterium]|nr:hypothetical protein [Alphaproteobacteria bacterium]